MDRGDQMLAYGGLSLIIGPREGEFTLRHVRSNRLDPRLSEWDSLALDGL